ncbi:MAG: hypothetical protein Q4A98_08210 [Comamonadaceae bacterium]|nr:hypothetical protein [Comamonadaceae bacterium]
MDLVAHCKPTWQLTLSAGIYNVGNKRHTQQTMTDKYNNDRGLSEGHWRYLTIAA